MLQVVHERCAGLDVHKKTVVACVLVTKQDGQVEQAKHTFGTTTGDIASLAEWLQGHEVNSVAMESTGVYWVPVYNLLEERFECVVVNAQHMKAVPGRKTDLSDAEWIGQLHRHGLLKGSFIPPKPQRQLRELVRHRTNMVERQSQSVNELQKVLETGNIKLASVVSEITGVSAMEMVQGLINGDKTPQELAKLARGRLREKTEQLEAALSGRLEKHHRFILSQLLANISFCQEQILELDLEIQIQMKEYQELIERLDKIPGVNQRIAQVMIAEVGTDMSRFGDAAHLISWAGMCPGNNQSGSKRRSCRLRQGNKSLKRALVEAAHAAGRKKDSYFSAQYHRLAARRGKKRAKVAVGRSILETTFHMIQRGSTYQDLGHDYFDRRDPEKLAKRLAERILRLGYTVSYSPTTSSSACVITCTPIQQAA
ncbi:MAG TPA: IS110 family transposase [Candidatus Paceibacterota bacterium]